LKQRAHWPFFKNAYFRHWQPALEKSGKEDEAKELLAKLKN
jgi:hypothetical protein